MPRPRHTHRPPLVRGLMAALLSRDQLQDDPGRGSAREISWQDVSDYIRPELAPRFEDGRHRWEVYRQISALVVNFLRVLCVVFVIASMIAFVLAQASIPSTSYPAVHNLLIVALAMAIFAMIRHSVRTRFARAWMAIYVMLGVSFAYLTYTTNPSFLLVLTGSTSSFPRSSTWVSLLTTAVAADLVIVVGLGICRIVEIRWICKLLGPNGIAYMLCGCLKGLARAAREPESDNKSTQIDLHAGHGGRLKRVPFWLLVRLLRNLCVNSFPVSPEYGRIKFAETLLRTIPRGAFKSLSGRDQKGAERNVRRAANLAQECARLTLKRRGHAEVQASTTARPNLCQLIDCLFSAYWLDDPTPARVAPGDIASSSKRRIISCAAITGTIATRWRGLARKVQLTLKAAALAALFVVFGIAKSNVADVLQLIQNIFEIMSNLFKKDS